MSERRPKYIQMMSPNQDALVDMLTLARGPIRSWAEYAKDCGVNPSTMSRIINGKLKSPLTIKTLEKLYEHRDEACKVTFDQFIIPSGMVDCDRQRTLIDERQAQRDEIDKVDELIARSIINGLYDRSIQFSRIKHVGDGCPREEEILTLFGDIHCSQLLKIGEDEDSSTVGFEYIPIKLTPEEAESEKTISRIIRRVVENYATIFLQDAWFTENRFSARVTFVFAERCLFEAFLKSFAKLRLNHYMTVLLVDIETTSVVTERPLGMQEGKTFSSLFDSPITERSGRRFGEQLNIFGGE